MKLRKYTLEQLKQAIKASVSYRQTLIKLSVVPAGGNYATLKKAIKYFNLDITHFLGHRSNLGRKFPGKGRPLEDYLNNKFFIGSYKLKNRLLKAGLLEPVCAKCGLTMWLGSPIPLELDHINGIRDDNSITNLRLLCPNCHALTDTYRGKNMLRKK